MRTIQTISVSDDGSATRNQVDGYEIALDGRTLTGPSTTGTVVATYAASLIPEIRVAARQPGFYDLGRIQVDADADLDEDDRLKAIRFSVYVEADLEGGTINDIVGRAREKCAVEAALRDGLEADVTVHTDAF